MENAMFSRISGIVPATRSRDRFQSERAFYEWTAHLQYERVPEALSWSDHHHAALLQYVEGNPVRTAVGIGRSGWPR